MNKNEKLFVNLLAGAVAVGLIVSSVWNMYKLFKTPWRYSEITPETRAVDYAFKFVNKKIKNGEYDFKDEEVAKEKMWNDFQFAKMMYRMGQF